MIVKFWKNITAALAFLLVQPLGLSLYYARSLPDLYYVRQGEDLEISTAIPVTASLTGEETAANLRLFGIVPVKTVSVETADRAMLVPSGEVFGIRMLMNGIMAVGFGEVRTQEGCCCPALTAGMEVGDVILAVNGVPVTSTEHFRSLTATDGALELRILRGEQELNLSVRPAYAAGAGCFQTGIWVRDSAAGIGTLTYYDPETGAFGGLGHPICDNDTGELIPLAKGTADGVTISGVVPGKSGIPGQLKGYFSSEEPLGTLTANSSCGIFGVLQEPDAGTAVPMAWKQEVHRGGAQILATVDGGEPVLYDIRITGLDSSDPVRNMTIEVTDPELLAKTGGIVQGMSGSPILQDGKLAGAVTHVFVEDPTRGYGIFAETMYAVTRSTAESPDRS